MLQNKHWSRTMVNCDCWVDEASDWAFDCLYWHGEILAGQYAHWCAEWDDLPVDETMGEFDVCHCFEALENTK